MRNINNSTVEYYDANAEAYFLSTVDADMSASCDRFLEYLPPDASVIDIGAGSGRDIKYFMSNGCRVEAIDASEELCRLASNYAGIKVECQKIQEWNPTHTYDGIWANASLLHLKLEEIQYFIKRIPMLLNDKGVAYVSLKSGIDTGCDDFGRYFTNMTEQKVQQIIAESTALKILDIWRTEDKLNRKGFFWINVIVQKMA